MNYRTITSLVSGALIITCAIICGCVAPDEQGQPVNTTVPLDSGWNQATVAILELYSLGIASQETDNRFNGSIVLPEPLVLLDSNGNPLYYRFYVQKNGEIFYAVQVSANKLLGKTVTEVGDFGYIGRDNSSNMPVIGNSSDVAESGFVCDTPIPQYGDEYAQLMLDSWEAEASYAESVMKDAVNAKIDLSKPLSDEERVLIEEILWTNIRQREQKILEIEKKYQVNIS